MFNIITSGARLSQFISSFQELPLGSLVISVDHAESTGLRSTDSGRRALFSALRVRETHGCKKLCVNSVLTKDNWDQVLEIGRSVVEATVDQWLVSPKLESRDGRMRPLLSGTEMIDFARGAADALGKSRTTRVLIDVHAQALIETFQPRTSELDPSAWCWRQRVNPDAPKVFVQAWNPGALFARIRWDGMVLGQAEVHAVGLERSELGRFRPGVLRELVQRWSASNRQGASACQNVA